MGKQAVFIRLESFTRYVFPYPVWFSKEITYSWAIKMMVNEAIVKPGTIRRLTRSAKHIAHIVAGEAKDKKLHRKNDR